MKHDFKNALCEVSRRLYQRGLAGGANGFLSLRIPERQTVLITGLGTSFEDIAPQEIVSFDLNDPMPADGSRPAEGTFLLEAYRNRSMVHAIGHLYPPYATAYSLMASEIPLRTEPGKRMLGETLWVTCKTCPSRFSGLCECISGRKKSPGGAHVLLIQDDGIVILAADLNEVFLLADLVEQSAKTAYVESGLVR